MYVSKQISSVILSRIFKTVHVVFGFISIQLIALIRSSYVVNKYTRTHTNLYGYSVLPELLKKVLHTFHILAAGSCDHSNG